VQFVCYSTGWKIEYFIFYLFYFYFIKIKILQIRKTGSERGGKGGGEGLKRGGDKRGPKD
jgi:hypothetical protein